MFSPDYNAILPSTNSRKLIFIAQLFNSIGILLCVYLYRSFGSIIFLFAGLIPVMSLIILSGVKLKNITLIVIILNLCVACAVALQIAILLWSGDASDYPMSTSVLSGFTVFFFVMAIINMMSLRKIHKPDHSGRPGGD